MADPARVRWHLEQAKQSAEQAIDGRQRYGEGWADDAGHPPVTSEGADSS